MTLADLLRPEYVQLRPVATSRDAAIREIAALLENDVKVLDWEEMHRRVTASAPCVAEPGAAFCMCLPHARTAAVTDMVISAGRFDPGLRIANVKQPVRYLFCIAVPPEMATGLFANHRAPRAHRKGTELRDTNPHGRDARRFH
jgi:PTS system nitrogen regulatory IIA component